MVETGIANPCRALVGGWGKHHRTRYPSQKSIMKRLHFRSGAQILACALAVCLLASSPTWAMSPQEFAELQQSARGKSAAESQLEVARCYEKGDGVEKNAVRALTWYSNAASNGSVEALDWLVARNKAKPRKGKVTASTSQSQKLVDLLAEYKNQAERAESSADKKVKKPAAPLKEVSSLLNAGADPNMALAPAIGGNTAVSAMGIAAELGNVKLNDLLRSRGGTFLLNWRNDVLGIMYRMGVAERRLASGADPAVERSLKREANSLRYMLAREYNARMLDTNGNTLLHRAALLESAESIAILVKAGAEVNQPNVPQEACAAESAWMDPQERTAIFAAISMGAANCVETLIRLGADVRYADKQGVTPEVWAQQSLERSRTSNIPEEVRAKEVRKRERCLELIRAAL